MCLLLSFSKVGVHEEEEEGGNEADMARAKRRKLEHRREQQLENQAYLAMMDKARCDEAVLHAFRSLDLIKERRTAMEQMWLDQEQKRRDDETATTDGD